MFIRIRIPRSAERGILFYECSRFSPFASGFGAPAFFTATLGVLIVVLEGLQSLNQFQHNWTTYRSTCEELKHEKFLWLAKAGPYANARNADALLAERVESLISREHTKWVSAQDQTVKQPKKSAT
ncbi:DUF4231 domain-containing protein [Candidatus Acetothermia bacterium]|nr:DUF4231 domain-containing protein [Candidatus Acetothermia bacterium]